MTPTAPIITMAASSDLPAVLHLLRECGLPTDGLADHVASTLVARVNDELLGCAALEMYADGALLRSVAVRALARGTGLGQTLTTAALNLAHTRRVPAVYLLTLTAEEFFPRFGFTRMLRSEVPPGVQQSVEFRSACPASAVVMKLALG